jgi:hypothetical protein
MKIITYMKNYLFWMSIVCGMIGSMAFGVIGGVIGLCAPTVLIFGGSIAYSIHDSLSCWWQDKKNELGYK